MSSAYELSEMAYLKECAFCMHHLVGNLGDPKYQPTKCSRNFMECLQG